MPTIQPLLPGTVIVVPAGVTEIFSVGPNVTVSISHDTATVVETSLSSQSQVEGGTATWAATLRNMVDLAGTLTWTTVRNLFLRVRVGATTTVSAAEGNYVGPLFEEDIKSETAVIDHKLYVSEIQGTGPSTVSFNSLTFYGGGVPGAGATVTVPTAQTTVTFTKPDTTPTGISCGDLTSTGQTSFHGAALTGQQAFIPDVIGGAIIDAEMRAAFAIFLDQWKAKGFMASS